MPKLIYPNRQIQLIAKVIGKLTKDIFPYNRTVIVKLLNTECWKDYYIDFWIPKEPKQILIEHRITSKYGPNDIVL